MAVRLAQTQVPIDNLISRRWSGRAFDPLKPVAREQLVALLEAARWAASCFNEQPWRFLVWDRNADANSWQKAFGCLGEWNQKWVINAPVLIPGIDFSDHLNYWKFGYPAVMITDGARNVLPISSS